METDWYFHMFYSMDWDFYCWTTYGRIFGLQGTGKSLSEALLFAEYHSAERQ